jgi:hypothetical protein
MIQHTGSSSIITSIYSRIWLVAVVAKNSLISNNIINNDASTRLNTVVQQEEQGDHLLESYLGLLIFIWTIVPPTVSEGRFASDAIRVTGAAVTSGGRKPSFGLLSNSTFIFIGYMIYVAVVVCFLFLLILTLPLKQY